MLQELNIKVLSYCDIPEKLTKEHCSLSESSCDSYIMYNVISKKEQSKYDDNFKLDNWIIKKYPELEGKDILIHIDY